MKNFRYCVELRIYINVMNTTKNRGRRQMFNNRS